MITQQIRNSLPRLFEFYNSSDLKKRSNKLFIKYGNLLPESTHLLTTNQESYLIITITQSLTKKSFTLSEQLYHINTTHTTKTHFTSIANLLSHLHTIYPNTIFYPLNHHSHEKTRFEDLYNLIIINQKISTINSNPNKFLSNINSIINNLEASLQDIENNINIRNYSDDNLDLISQEIEDITS